MIETQSREYEIELDDRDVV